MKHRTRVISLIIIISLSLITSPALAAPKHRKAVIVELNTLHIFLNQAYLMVLEGSGLVMLGEINTSTVFKDTVTLRGWELMEQGRQLIKNSLNGLPMKKLEVKYKNDPLMKRVHDLGNMMLEGVEIIEKYLKVEKRDSHNSTIHQLHILLNHGLKMAADGSNMILLGRTGLAKGANDLSQKHGRTMMRDGRVFIVRLSDDESMRELHNIGVNPAADARMDLFHQSIIKSLRIIDSLARI